MKIQFSILVILLGFMMSFSYAEDKNDPPKKPTDYILTIHPELLNFTFEFKFYIQKFG